MRWICAIAIILPVMGMTAGRAADPAVPKALAGLEPGQWELRSRDPGEPVRRLCIHDFQTLIQMRHQGQSCRHFVVENLTESASVTYNCPRTGHGMTVVRMETVRLVQIDSQGVEDGFPFALNLEGRRIGTCAATAERK
jgi:hypothetical protein